MKWETGHHLRLSLVCSSQTPRCPWQAPSPGSHALIRSLPHSFKAGPVWPTESGGCDSVCTPKPGHKSNAASTWPLVSLIVVEASHHAVRQLHWRACVDKTWGHRPTANTDLPSIWVSHLKPESSSPNQAFGWHLTATPWDSPSQNCLVELLPNSWPTETMRNIKWLLLF